MPFADNTFSIVHSRGLDARIYKLSFPKLLQEIARVLKKDGIFSVYGTDLPITEEMQKYFRLLTPDRNCPALLEKL